MKASDTEIGKAFKAYSTFNHKAKKGRIETFDLSRWLRVVHALNGKGVKGLRGTGTYQPRAQARQSQASKKTRKWTPQQRVQYKQTILNRKVV